MRIFSSSVKGEVVVILLSLRVAALSSDVVGVDGRRRLHRDVLHVVGPTNRVIVISGAIRIVQRSLANDPVDL